MPRLFFMLTMLLAVATAGASAEEARVLFDAQGFAAPGYQPGPIAGQNEWQTNAPSGSGFTLIETGDDVTLKELGSNRGLVSADVEKLAAAWRTIDDAGTRDKVRVTFRVLLPAGKSGGMRRLNMALLEGRDDPRQVQAIPLEVIRMGSGLDAPFAVRTYLANEKRSVVLSEIVSGDSGKAITIVIDADYATNKFVVRVDDGSGESKTSEPLSWVSEPDKSAGRLRGVYLVALAERRFNIRPDLAVADVKVEIVR